MSVQAAEKLLDDFRALPGRVERPRTFMEIAGYPHYENVCSNILAFFMDPEEAHGFKTLVLDALANAVEIDLSESSISSNASVGREVVTESGNRIDLLITSDDHAILIENKIYAIANNPFDDYARYLSLNYEDLIGHKILLTVFPTNEGHEWSFTNLTYEDFVGQIRSLLDHYIANADARYLTLFLDFLNTLENLHRGTRMDTEFIKLLADRDKEIRELLNDLKSFRAEMRKKVEELKDLIDTSQHRSVEIKDLWRGDIVSMSDNLYFKIRVAEDLLVGIDTYLSPHGWEIQIFPRDKGDPSKLKNILEHLKIPFEKKERFIHTADFSYDANLERIRPVLQDVVDKLATFKEAGSGLDPV